MAAQNGRAEEGREERRAQAMGMGKPQPSGAPYSQKQLLSKGPHLLGNHDPFENHSLNMQAHT